MTLPRGPSVFLGLDCVAALLRSYTFHRLYVRVSCGIHGRYKYTLLHVSLFRLFGLFNFRGSGVPNF